MTKDEAARELYQHYSKIIANSAELYQNDAKNWHKTANAIAPFNPGLAAVVRDVANAFQTIGQRAADMKNQ